MFFKEYLTAKNVIFFILVVLLLKFMTSIDEIVMLFFASYVIACSLLPLVLKLEKKRMNTTLATVVVLTVTTLLTGAVFVPIFSVIIDEIIRFGKAFPLKYALLNDFVHAQHVFGHRLSDFIDMNAIAGSTTEIIKSIASRSLTFTLGFMHVVIILIAILTIVFYLLKDRIYLKDKFISFFPDKMRNKADFITRDISEKVGGYVLAQVISNIFIWILVSISLLIFKVDYALLLGLIASVLDIIPVLGPTVALALILITAAPLGVGVSITLIIIFLLIQQLSNNIIRPVVFGKFLNLHPLSIIFALFVAAQFLGVWGVILAPAIAAIVCVLVDELYLQPINKN